MEIGIAISTTTVARTGTPAPPVTLFFYRTPDGFFYRTPDGFRYLVP